MLFLNFCVLILWKMRLEMSYSNIGVFTKDNLETYLKELAKEYRKLGGKGMPAEIILIGGAAIIANYGFRDILGCNNG